MQWLIDLVAARVIDTIGIPPVFIDRGDPAADDFIETDLTADQNWHDLDLSPIVPAGASAVVFTLYLQTTLAGKIMLFKTKENVNSKNISRAYGIAGGIGAAYDCTVPLDTNRKIEYWMSVAVWTRARICVKGWWL